MSLSLWQALFTDPVVAADGYTYERAAVHDWLYRYGTASHWLAAELLCWGTGIVLHYIGWLLSLLCWGSLSGEQARKCSACCVRSAADLEAQC